ncbi:MAG: metallophosphoesterase [Pirellulaceae bacterium]|nr:metallophosphoesterase [Pirellulaceae bacterium]
MNCDSDARQPSKAIISDIHGNVEALMAVLEKIESLGIDQIVCLGDIVGYGPNPVDCIHLLKDCETIVTGDWDAAAISAEDPCWSPLLLEQLNWVRGEMAHDQIARQILGRACIKRRADNIAFFHAMPNDFSDWIFPEDVFTPEKLDRVIEQSASLAFCGHNHLAGLHSKTPQWSYLSFVEAGDDWYTAQGPCICSVGSVGQPRDSDPRASFVVLRDRQFRFVRVDYDHHLTAAKIRANPSIRDLHADRLFLGRQTDRNARLRTPWRHNERPGCRWLPMKHWQVAERSNLPTIRELIFRMSAVGRRRNGLPTVTIGTVVLSKN